MEVVESVQLPPTISEAIVDNQVIADSPPGSVKSLQSLVDKYCVYTGYIDLDRISPGNNPRIVRQSSVKIIKDSILNSGWDDSSLFIISVVTDEDTLTDPVKVRSTPELLSFVINNACFVFVNGHHRDLALKLMKSAKFQKFPLPKKVKCQVCVGISNWDHFLISKKANFVSCAAAPDTIYDKIRAVDRAIEQYTLMNPKERQVETKIKNFFEHEVGEKTISAASFNLYFNLAKLLSPKSKAVLKQNTEQSAGEFLTTDAMKHIVQETKKKFKDCEFLAQKYHIACIDSMFRYYAYKGTRMSSTFFPTISVYIETQVHFFGTMLTQIADSFQLEEEVVDLPNPILQWFKTNLDNFDVSDAGLENVQLFVENTSPLLGSNSGHLPHDLRVIVNRFVTGTLKKEGAEKPNKKKGREVQSTPVPHIDSDVEEFCTPSKKGKGKVRRNKPAKILQEDKEKLEAKETSKEMSDTETEPDQPAPFTDPATKYLHRLSAKTLESLKASWIGPHNCTVNTIDTDTVEKARSEWVVIRDAPFDPKVDKLTTGAAFVCLDIREPFDRELSYIISCIAALAPKVNRGGCFIIVGTAEQVFLK